MIIVDMLSFTAGESINLYTCWKILRPQNQGPSNAIITFGGSILIKSDLYTSLKVSYMGSI